MTIGSNMHPVFQQALAPFLHNGKPAAKPKPAHYHIILAHALYDMNCKINDGGEFPDVAYNMATRYGVRQGDLEHMYDAQFQD